MYFTIVTPSDYRHRGELNGVGIAKAYEMRGKIPGNEPYELQVIPQGHNIAHQTARYITGSELNGHCLHLLNLHWTGLSNIELTRILNRHLNVRGFCQSNSIQMVRYNVELVTALTVFAKLAKEQLIATSAKYGHKRMLVVMEGLLLQATVAALLGQTEPYFSDVFGYCEGYDIYGDSERGWSTYKLY